MHNNNEKIILIKTKHMKILKFTLLLFTLGFVTVTSCDDDNFSEYNNKSIIKITGATLDFGNTIVPSTSDVRTYTVAAKSLSGDITINTEAPFSISKSFNSDFSTSLELEPSDFNKEALTIYVRFDATSQGSYTGTITHTSLDRDNILSISLTANAVLPTPTIAISKPNLLFNGVEAGQESLPQNYTITAQNLTMPLTVLTESPFSIAISENGTYSTSIDFEPADLNSGTATVFVKFSPTEGGSVMADITHISNELENIQSVALSGTTAVVSTLQMSDNFNYPLGFVPTQDRTGDGSINAGLSGWIKVRTGNTNIPIVDDRLSYSGYLPSDIGNAVELDMDPGSNSNVYAYNLTDQQDGGAVGSYYASFMIRVDALPTAQFNMPVMFTDWLPNGTVRFLGAMTFQFDSGTPKFAVKYGPQISLVTSTTPEVGKTYLVVLKNTVTDNDINNDNNTASVYIYDAESIPATEPATAAATVSVAAGDDAYGVKSIVLFRDNDHAGKYIVDGLRVAQTWEDLFVN
tara:strand:- start:7741 stop:9300 length:1560 start_codon:yes stop_codon:yes gene_type:complete